MLGVWLVQLGTPAAPSRAETKRYLDEFLMDPRMIELPHWARTLLVKGIITPFRSGKSARAYAKIWMNEGSPLAVYSKQLADKLQSQLGSHFHVQLGMRYGEPSIETSWNQLRKLNLEKIIVLPLFPQYCSATTASVYDKVFEVMKKEVSVPAFHFLPPFYNQNFFIDSFVERGREVNVNSFDQVLFSFHGIPEKLVRRAGTKCLVMNECCLQTENPFCYRNHCVKTAEAIRQGLGIESSKTKISFQSRLGREKWLDPYTDKIIPQLAKQGVKRLAVFSPSFVADCLETLEEIGIRAKEDFLLAGGEELVLVPSLNDQNAWVSGLSAWLRSQISEKT